MELVTELINNQLTLCIPVALVLIFGLIVFAFGFKSAEQPPFDKLSSLDERKPAGKKRKIKEKKPAVNGHIVNVGDSKGDKSPSKHLTKDQLEAQKSDNVKQQEKKRSEPVKVKKLEKTDEIKHKKNLKSKSVNEKPADFDDGNWETVPTKGDKKKKQESPDKKDTKSKKIDNTVEIDKLVEDMINQELEQDKREDFVPTPTLEDKVDISIGGEIIVEELKIEKKNGKRIKKEVFEKAEAVPFQAIDVKSEPVSEKPLTEIVEKSPAGDVAFDELGDLWTEAKVVKKTKKKSRRDN